MKIKAEDLKCAIADDELELFYQPKVSLVLGRVIGAEALVRWCRKDGTIVGPDNFIPLAESSGLLQSLTIQMLGRAVSTIEKLHARTPGLSLSMNATPADLESHHISELIESYLLQRRIRPSDLQIEITESAAMSDFDRVYDDLLRLNTLGIKVLMDDFGTGYSSLDRLSQLPFSSLKLDKGVVSRMTTSMQNLNVVRSSISLARELRMTSIAEGVESEEDYNFLLANGCEEAQGFWISRPLNLADYENFLAEDRRYAGSQFGQLHQAGISLIQSRKYLVDAAFCQNLKNDTSIDSLVDPEVRLAAPESRFGQWYYGIGSVLGEMPEFVALEAPFLAMHEQGLQFMHLLESHADSEKLQKALARVDQELGELTGLLQSIERKLLSS